MIHTLLSSLSIFCGSAAYQETLSEAILQGCISHPHCPSLFISLQILQIGNKKNSFFRSGSSVCGDIRSESRSAAFRRREVTGKNRNLNIRKAAWFHLVNLLNQLMQLSVWKHHYGYSPDHNSFQSQDNDSVFYLRSVCTGQDHVSISSPGPRSCSVTLERAEISDRGRYMCLLNQADVFHTDRRWEAWSNI